MSTLVPPGRWLVQGILVIGALHAAEGASLNKGAGEVSNISPSGEYGVIYEKENERFRSATLVSLPDRVPIRVLLEDDPKMIAAAECSVVWSTSSKRLACYIDIKRGGTTSIYSIEGRTVSKPYGVPELRLPIYEEYGNRIKREPFASVRPVRWIDDVTLLASAEGKLMIRDTPSADPYWVNYNYVVTISCPSGRKSEVIDIREESRSGESDGSSGGSDEHAGTPPEPAVTQASHSLNTVFDNGPYADYNSYSRRQILKKAQRKLREAGLYHSGIDGAMGPGTQSAIVEWQRNQNIPVTGLLDYQTVRSMYLLGLAEQTPPRRRVYRGEQVGEYPRQPDAAEVINRALDLIPH